MAAWVTKETLDSSDLDARGKPKRKRERCEPGQRGVKDSDRFVVEWLEPDGNRVQRKITNRGKQGKSDADKLCSKTNAELTLGTYEAQRTRGKSDPATWANAKQWFLDDVLPTKRSEFTRIEITKSLERFEKLAAPRMVADVTTALIDRFIAARLKQTTRDDEPISHATVNKDLRTVKAVFKKFAKWKLLKELPEIEMLEETEHEKPVYTEAEFSAMYGSCGVATLPAADTINGCPVATWWQTLLVMFWETGVRRRELLSLRWSEVDLARGCITVNPANTKSKRLKQHTFGEWGREHLQRLASYGTSGANGEPGMVFWFPHDLARLNDTLGEIQTAAKIDTSRQNLKFHAFRRTVGNMTAELYGLDAAQRKLGHSSSAITAKHYAQAAMRTLAAKSLMPVPSGLRIVG